MEYLKRKVEVNFKVLKVGINNNELSITEIDLMTCELITFLAILTNKGETNINQKETVDKYKERVWNIVENNGLLPEL
jgi:hypothetical protein